MRMLGNGIAERIRTLRTERNLTQEQMALLLGISQKSIAAYESGAREPSPKVLITMARVFHVSTDFLLGIEEKKVLDVSGLSDHQIQTLLNLIDAFQIRKTE